MRKKRKTFLSEIWDSVILTQSVLQWEFVVWYISQVSNSYLSRHFHFQHRFRNRLTKQNNFQTILFVQLVTECLLKCFTNWLVSQSDHTAQSHQPGTPVDDFHPQPNITQFDRGQLYYIEEYSYCMPGSNHVYCILGSLKREISLEFESYISQWHCRIQVIWSA